jgi:hypothetical protein
MKYYIIYHNENDHTIYLYWNDDKKENDWTNDFDLAIKFKSNEDALNVIDVMNRKYSDMMVTFNMNTLEINKCQN